MHANIQQEHEKTESNLEKKDSLKRSVSISIAQTRADSTNSLSYADIGVRPLWIREHVICQDIAYITKWQTDEIHVMKWVSGSKTLLKSRRSAYP